jgi:hypothetical protein
MTLTFVQGSDIMFSEILRVLPILDKLSGTVLRVNTSVSKQLRELELCVEKFKRALHKNDLSGMRQASAEFEELMHLFNSRLFQGIPTERDDRLRGLLYEAHERDDVDAWEMDVIDTNRPELEKLLDTLIGTLRGLRRGVVSHRHTRPRARSD